ncbi:MAG: GSCFA domain-containing protein [Bacteroidales bacterium]|nr:MAG: GSCFA domain-containing protein [Bacteroidales bacterium]
MNQFRTTFSIPAYSSRLSYRKPALFMGSCFSETIGGKLKELKFPVDINPFGIIYNPVSVKNSLDILIREKEFSRDDLHQFEGQWISFYHQTAFSDPDPEECLDTINNSIRFSSQFLRKANFLFITFGTAWIYKWKATGQVVSNCHKIPAKKFHRELIEAGEIAGLYTELIDELKNVNPALKIIFTVSPVRHWKDGAEGNQISKATLHLAIRHIRTNFPETGYFPAYEIVMDDLRDYRFYAEDMIHLNRVAADYIWGKFENAFIDEESGKIINEVRNILSAYRHRPIKPGSEAHMVFLKKHLEITGNLREKYPFLNLDQEMDYFAGKND